MAHRKHKRFYTLPAATPKQLARVSEPRETTYFSPSPTFLWSGRGASFPQNAYQPLNKERQDALNRLYRQSQFLHRRNSNTSKFRPVPSQFYMPQPSLRPPVSYLPHLQQQSRLCTSRHARRRVLFALSFVGAGRGGSNNPPRWTEASYISCK
jgi:hypothetical protein